MFRFPLVMLRWALMKIANKEIIACELMSHVFVPTHLLNSERHERLANTTRDSTAQEFKFDFITVTLLPVPSICERRERKSLSCAVSTTITTNTVIILYYYK